MRNKLYSLCMSSPHVTRRHQKGCSELLPTRRRVRREAMTSIFLKIRFSDEIAESIFTSSGSPEGLIGRPSRVGSLLARTTVKDSRECPEVRFLPTWLPIASPTPRVLSGVARRSSKRRYADSSVSLNVSVKRENSTGTTGRPLWPAT